MSKQDKYTMEPGSQIYLSNNKKNFGQKWFLNYKIKKNFLFFFSEKVWPKMIFEQQNQKIFPEIFFWIFRKILKKQNLGKKIIEKKLWISFFWKKIWKKFLEKKFWTKNCDLHKTLARVHPVQISNHLDYYITLS